MHQLKVATILPKAPTPPPTQTPGSRSKFNFQNMVMLHMKGNHECSNIVSNADRGKIRNLSNVIFIKGLCPTLWVDLRGGVKRLKFNFFQIMVMLNIKLKRNHECSNVVANLSANPLPSHPTLGVKRSKFNFYRTWSYQIRFTNAETWRQILCPQTFSHPHPTLGWC